MQAIKPTDAEFEKNCEKLRGYSAKDLEQHLEMEWEAVKGKNEFNSKNAYIALRKKEIARGERLA